MPLVIAGGKSVLDYPQKNLYSLCLLGFTFTVNHSAFYFPTDVIVSLDFEFIRDNAERLKKIGKPIITRKWDCLQKLGLELWELPNNICEKWKLSGHVACKLSDTLATKLGKNSYVLGIDGTSGHFYDRPESPKTSDCGAFEAPDLQSTINLGIHSKIAKWPKISKLPHPRKIIMGPNSRKIAVAWVHAYAEKILMGETK